MDKGYSFNSHSISVAASVRNKVEKLSTVVKYLNMTNRKRITESIVISTLSYCLALWGFKKKWRRKCQKAMNTAIRMILETDNRYSITDGLALLEWPNMDNLWRLEQINVMRRITQTQIPTSVYSIITGRTQGRYLIRADGIRSTWRPHNTHCEHAFIHKAVEVYNDLRVTQRLWFNDKENRAMSKSEVRSVLKLDLIAHFGNANI